MELEQVYLGLGGNIGDTASVFQQVLEKLAADENINAINVSQFHQTTPVSTIKQRDYLNAVCSFKTAYSVEELFKKLQKVESDLGKTPKLKDEPRVIDLDILLFGKQKIQIEKLEVPHPYWKERLFVLEPLADIAEEVETPEGKVNIKELIDEKSGH